MFSSPSKLLIASRRSRVVELRVQGHSLDSIADTIRSEFGLEHYSRQRSHEDLMRSLKTVGRMTAREVCAYRRIEEMRLDFMWTRLLPAMREGDEKSITAGIKLCRAKSQLMGLDAGTQTIVENSVKQELNSVLNQLQNSFDPKTYEVILGVIARSGDDNDDDDYEGLEDD
jgi:hypothetical protein